MIEGSSRRGDDVVDVDLEPFRAAARYWWIFLVIGVGWLLFSIIVFRFDYRSVSAISILFGIVVLAAAIDELIAVFAGDRSAWARVGHALLAVACLIIGVVAFVHPGNTFAALAAVMSFYFILIGTLNIWLSFLSKGAVRTWWIQFSVGLAEIVIGFWAAGDFGHKTILLVVWVGVAALTRGISAITFALVARDLRAPD